MSERTIKIGLKTYPADGPEYEFLKTGYWPGAGGRALSELHLPTRPIPNRPGQTFDTFITDSSNSMAWQAVRERIAAQQRMPMLCIEGPLESGKSHLLHALRAAREDILPSKSSDFISVPLFESELEATATYPARRALISNIGTRSLVCIDDLDYAIGKPALGAALSELVCKLRDARSLVVFTVKNRDELLGKLFSRALKEAIGDAEYQSMQPFTAALRSKLLTQFATEQNLVFTPAAHAALLVASDRSSAGELRGLVTQVRALRRELMHVSDSDTRPVELADVRLAQLSRNSGVLANGVPISTAMKRGKVSLASLRIAVCTFFECSEADLCTRSRDPSLVLARGMFVYLGRRMVSPVPSYPELGHFVSSHQSHTTALTAYQVFEGRLATDPLSIPDGPAAPGNTKTLAEIVSHVAELARDYIHPESSMGRASNTLF
jgi:chromosomal replication initiation ATPase DnaA